MKKKVAVVFGTRPEAIKMAPIVHELQMNHDSFEIVVIVTAQHREMLDQVLDVFSIVPHYDLNIMTAGQTLSGITSHALTSIEQVLQKEQPNVVLVHGDTTTAMAASLAAFYQKIPVGHVEAGLRTREKYSPFPEEVNRQLIGRLATFHFAPTETAKANLEKESCCPDEVLVTGNTAIDALKQTIQEEYQHPLLNKLSANDRLLLLTMHRRENLGEPMRRVFSAISRLAADIPDITIIYPVHLNPLVQQTADELLASADNIHLIEPLDVLDFHNLAKRSHLILTDSGGIQEEAPSLGVPVFVLRDTTERPEGVAAGALRLIGTEEQAVYESVKSILSDEQEYQKMAFAKNPYGDGTASRQIVSFLLANL